MRTELGDALRAIPSPEVAHDSRVAAALTASEHYLASNAALRSLEADAYWPKWDSPWWHMVLLHELGEVRRIPERAIRMVVARLNALPLKIFPLHPEDSPPGTDPYRDSQCHCALGCMYQVSAEFGLDAERELPWVKPWFVRYQMADGGLNCDSTAYLQHDECASSMVGTVAVFEAMLLGPESWTPSQVAFLERAADFLIAREVMLGSSSNHNSEERAAQAAWRLPCFPRFYFYDVVRGASALVHWAERSGRSLPVRAIAGVVEYMASAFPDGVVALGRRAYAGSNTIVQTAAGAWIRGQPASTFPLLESTSVVGAPCPFVTRQWSTTRRAILRLIETGQLVE